MPKLKSEWLRRFIYIVPFKDTYFIKKDIPDVKLNKDIVRLNYSIYSPFKEGDILFYKDKSCVYIWFVKNRINTKKICIPEGFLMYLAYKKRFTKDGFSIKKFGERYLVIAVKNGEMVSQILTKSVNDFFLNILQKEHSMENGIEILHVKDEDFDIDIQTLIKFFDSFDVSFSTIFNDLYEQVKIPVIVSLALINILDIFMYKYVDNTVKKSKHELQELIKNNKELKLDFLTLENESKFWKSFIVKELKYPNIYKILSVISKEVLKSKGSINIFRQSGNLVDMWVVSNSTATVVNNLSKTGYFSNIKILSTSQYYKDKKKEVGEIELRVKEKSSVR